jgi:hypothetical protein
LISIFILQCNLVFLATYLRLIYVSFLPINYLVQYWVLPTGSLVHWHVLPNFLTAVLHAFAEALTTIWHCFTKSPKQQLRDSVINLLNPSLLVQKILLIFRCTFSLYLEDFFGTVHLTTWICHRLILIIVKTFLSLVSTHVHFSFQFHLYYSLVVQ